MGYRLLFLQVLLQFLLTNPTSANDVGRNLELDGDAWERDFGSYPYRSYQSFNCIAPSVKKAVDSPQCYDDNYIFLALRGKQVSHPALTVLDNQGELVWQEQVKGEPYNLEVQEYRGEKVLTYWLGDDTVGGHGEGTFHIYNSKYEEIANMSGSPGLRPDLHEFVITPEGTALITIYQVHLVSHPGLFRLKDTVWVWDCLFEEVDIATGKKLFQWRASDHHSLNETYRLIRGDGFSKDHPWDWYHINSVQKDELGNFLVSARYTNTVTYVDGKSGEIIWILGGKENSFKDTSKGGGKAIDMAFQHDARFHGLAEFPNLLAEELKAPEKDGVTRKLLTAFDNAADEWIGERPSRGVLIELTYPTNAKGSSSAPYTARLVKSYDHPGHFIALSQGGMQLIKQKDSDPRILIGYGHVGAWAEFSADGKLLCDRRLSTAKSWSKGPVQSYRTYKSPWVGEPTWPPEVALGSSSSLFVSWNGATEVHSWKAQKLDGENWLDIATVEKKTFETMILYEVDDETRYLRIVALGKDGRVLGTSAEVDLKQRMSIPKSPSGIVTITICVSVLVLLYKSIRRFRKRLSRGYSKLPRYE